MTDEKSNKNDDGKLRVMKLNDHKAGMQGLDITRINQIIEEASKGSKFYLHKQKNQERIDKKYYTCIKFEKCAVVNVSLTFQDC